MKKIKVHGTRPKGHPFPVISYGIRLLEWSDISHVATELEDGRIYHAHFNEVRFECAEDWKKTVEILYTYEVAIPEEMYLGMLDWCEGFAGEKSGYFCKLFGCLIPQFLRIFGIYVHNTFVKDMNKAALCSELVRFMARRFWSFDVPDRPYPECFTTQDVLRMMENNNASVG